MAPEISLPLVAKSKPGAKALELLKKLNGLEDNDVMWTRNPAPGIPCP